MFEKELMKLLLFSYKKYSSVIILLVLLIAISGIVWFGIRPLKQSLNNKMRAIQEYYAGQENSEKQVNRLPELKDQYNAIIENEPTLNILIKKDQIVDFIKTLEGLASEMNVRMTIASKENGQIVEVKKVPTKPASAKEDDASLGAEKVSTKPKIINIVDDVPYDRYLRLSITTEGQYEDIAAFLQKIETLPIGLDVVGVEVKKSDEETMTGSSTPRSAGNPFTFLGDGTFLTQEAPQVIEKNALIATFDVLVYVDKNN
jgi:Tfp pilus assembly protein PilO